MTLFEYIKMSYLRPNLFVLKGLGASDDLIEYLMETPSNTNMAIVSHFITSEESNTTNESSESNGGSNSGSESGSGSGSGSGSNSGEGGSEGGSETPAPTSYTVRLKEYPNQLEADYPTYVVPVGESISINDEDAYSTTVWGEPWYWYDIDDPERIGLSKYNLANYTPTKDTLLILNWWDPARNFYYYDDYYAEPITDEHGNGDLTPTFDDPQ